MAAQFSAIPPLAPSPERVLIPHQRPCRLLFHSVRRARSSAVRASAAPQKIARPMEVATSQARIAATTRPSAAHPEPALGKVTRTSVAPVPSVVLIAVPLPSSVAATNAALTARSASARKAAVHPILSATEYVCGWVNAALIRSAQTTRRLAKPVHVATTRASSSVQVVPQRQRYRLPPRPPLPR